jgi:hypothetical protein
MTIHLGHYGTWHIFCFSLFFFPLLFARANIYSRSKQEERATTVGGNPPPHPYYFPTKNLLRNYWFLTLHLCSFPFLLLKKKIKVTRKMPACFCCLYLELVKEETTKNMRGWRGKLVYWLNKTNLCVVVHCFEWLLLALMGLLASV